MEFTNLINQLLEKKNLTQKQAFEVMGQIMTGKLTPSQIAGFLVALRTKGETVDEIAGCALAMRGAAQNLNFDESNVLDNCGTGGDGKGTINISTAAAFVVAGAGFVVAKHGNRSVSSKCGSADVLELLGVKVGITPGLVEHSLNVAGIGFMFAPMFHPAMKHAMPTRKELGIRTVFNILGPLTNPARAQVQLIGVYTPKLLNPMAQVLAKMKHKAGLVVHSNGWDEITLDNKTQVAEMLKGRVKTYSLTHKDFGLPRVSSKQLKGGDAATNAKKIIETLDGAKGPLRDVVVANAAALIWIAHKGLNLGTLSLKEAVKKAELSIDTGQARHKLEKMAQVSQQDI